MIYFKRHLCIIFQNREPLHSPGLYVFLVKKCFSFWILCRWFIFEGQKITLYSLELTSFPEGSPKLGNETTAHRDFDSRFFPATISPYLLLIKVSKEAKYFKKHKFLGLVRYFSSWIEKLLKNLESRQKSTLFWGFFKVYSILVEK